MTIGRYVIVFFIILLGMCVSIATADTLYIQNGTVSNPGESITVDIILDEAPLGLSGYNISVELLSPEIGEIVGITFPYWATLTGNSSIPADSVIIKGVDSGQQISPPSYNVSFGTVTIRGDQEGTSIVNITINVMDDYYGDIFRPEVRAGTFTVGTPVTPTPTPTSPPDLPHLFYGTAVLADGEDAPAGTDVDALVTGVSHPATGNPLTITVPGMYGGSGATDPKLVVQGSIADGAPIEFYIGGVLAECYDVVQAGGWMNSYPYHSGSVTELNLRIPPEIPHADFIVNETEGISPLSVAFTDLSTGQITGWEWDFGDGSANVTDQNPEHTFTATVNTTYTVTLTVSNEAGSSSKSTDITVNVIPSVQPPVADFASNETEGISPLSVAFTDLSTGIVTGWEWDFGDGSANVTDQNPEHTFTTIVNTTYTVTLTVSNEAGSSSKSTDITVNVIPAVQPPVAGFTSSQTTGGAPLIVQFDDASTNAPDSWLWTFGDGGSSAEQNPLYMYASPGIYTVNLTVSNAGGQDTLSREGYIVVNPEFYADFDANPTSGDSPLTVSFTDKSTGDPLVMFYNFGDGSTARSRNPVHTYRYPGTYDVSLTIWKQIGGSFISTTTVKTALITVEGGTTPVLKADFVAGPIIGKAPLTVYFTDWSSGNPKYWTYDFGDGFTSSSKNPVHTYQRPGTYTVKQTVMGFGPNFSLQIDSKTKVALITVLG